MSEAIAWKYRTGSPWRDLPPELGSWNGAYPRLRRWAIDGTWQRLFTAMQADADGSGELNRLVAAVDSTMVRAHQHAAGLRPGKTVACRVQSRQIMAAAGPVVD